jgi:hypothetical protein
MELNDSLAFGPRSVFHAGGPVTEGPSRKFLCAIAIERFSCCEMQGARNYGDPLGLQMGVRRD